MRRALAVVFAMASVAGVGATPGAASFALQGRVVNASFASAAGSMSYAVYLPPGYDSSNLRYPVVYYLHGLPAGTRAFTAFTWVPAALEADKLQAIVVAPASAAPNDTDPEYLDKGPGEEWETAISVQLPNVIDAQYRTIATRAGRAIVGVSAGGYGAMMLGLHHLPRFSAIESWSGYFHPTDPTGVTSISTRPWLSAHSFVASLRRAFAVNPTFLGFYVGAGDKLFRSENVEFARELSRAGVPFRFRMYPGGHAQTLWSAQAPDWLTALMSHLAPPS